MRITHRSGRVHAAGWHANLGIFPLLCEIARGSEPAVPERTIAIAEAWTGPQISIHLGHILYTNAQHVARNVRRGLSVGALELYTIRGRRFILSPKNTSSKASADDEFALNVLLNAHAKTQNPKPEHPIISQPLELRCTSKDKPWSTRGLRGVPLCALCWRSSDTCRTEDTCP